MTNAWTGGQYSLYRALFGAFLFIRLASGMGSADSIDQAVGLLAGAGASLALAIGMRDRIAAILLVPILLLFSPQCPSRTSSETMADPASLILIALLLAHALLPPAPFGSWDARGRPDPDGGWRMPGWLHASRWILLAGAHAWAGWAGWRDSSGTAVRAGSLARLLFAPLALIRRLRPWLWVFFFAGEIGRLVVVGPDEAVAAMILLHLSCFDPGWIPGRLPEPGPTLVFYDGACGLCHRTIRFLLAEDASGDRFRFAPLDSEAFRAATRTPGSGLEARRPIPDSVLVARPGEELLSRGAGLLEIGHQLGGIWRLLAMLAGGLPPSLLDSAYDFVARHRSRLFSRPGEDCPILTDRLRARFLD